MGLNVYRVEDRDYVDPVEPNITHGWAVSTSLCIARHCDIDSREAQDAFVLRIDELVRGFVNTIESSDVESIAGLVYIDMFSSGDDAEVAGEELLEFVEHLSYAVSRDSSGLIDALREIDESWFEVSQHEYVFDVVMRGTVRVTAKTEAEARKKVMAVGEEDSGLVSGEARITQFKVDAVKAL